MSTYHVDSEHILNASTQVNSSIESIRSSVSTMCAQLADLEASWQGSASTLLCSNGKLLNAPWKSL